MNHSNNNDSRAFDAVINDIWEASDERLSDVAVNEGIEFRIIDYSIENALDFRYELRSKPGAPLLVPIGGRIKLLSSRPAQNEWQAHRFIRARASALTCSHATTSSG